MNDPSSPITTLRGLDPEMLATAIRGAHLEPCQLSARPAQSRIASLRCPNVGLDFAALGPAMLFTGEMSPSCFTMVFVLACPEKGRSFNFGVEHTDGYMAIFPPGGILDAFTPAGYANATLTVPAADFRAALAAYFPDIPDKILSHGAGMRIGPDEQTRLRTLLSAVQETIWRSGDELDTGLARRALQADLLAGFLSALRDGCDSLVAPATQRVIGRQRRLRLAREYLVAHLHQPIRLADLSTTLGLSPRSVENLFHDYFGVRPSVFVRHQRMHVARRALKNATSSPGMVKQVALECGFWHFGRFAGQYRALFGETPSQTLAGRNDGH